MSEQASWADAREALREILGVEGPARQMVLANVIAAAEERGRRRGLEEAARVASGYTLDPEARNVHHDIAFKDMSETARMISHTTAQGIAMAILDLAPGPSGGERNELRTLLLKAGRWLRVWGQDMTADGFVELNKVRHEIAALAPRDSAPGCICHGGKTQPYCAYCLGMSAPRDSGKEPVLGATRVVYGGFGDEPFGFEKDRK